MEPVPVSIIITTHNRVSVLRETLERLQKLDPPPREILVCADGCTDGTKDFLDTQASCLRIFENNPGKGSVASRDLMLREATAEYALMLDDDSYPHENDFLGIAVKFLRSQPHVGILSFPQRTEEFPETLQIDSFGETVQPVGTFVCSGAILRRDLFEPLGGFPGFFFHAYEEPDYALRVIAAGHGIVQFNARSIRHYFTSVGRNEGRTHRRHSRNEAWSVLMRAPFWLVPILLLGRVFTQMRFAFSRGADWVIREPEWWWLAIKGFKNALAHRKPVSASAYFEWLKRMRNPPQPESIHSWLQSAKDPQNPDPSA